MLCRRLLLVTLCALLAACDSGEAPQDGAPPPAVAPAFVGTWAAQTQGQDTYATLSQSQTALDPFSPARGEVRIDGAFTSTLRYLTYRSVHREAGEMEVSIALTSAPNPVPGTPFVVLNASYRFASIGIYARSGEEGRAFFPQFPLVAPPVSQSGDTLRVGPTVYRESPSTGASVTVQGTLVLPRRRIEEGVETHMSQNASFFNGDAVALTIRADGTFSETNRGSLSRSGTWRAGPDSTITFSSSASDVYTRRYRVAGSTLRLESTESFGCDAACRVQVEDAADLLPGSVRSARLVYVSTYTRT